MMERERSVNTGTPNGGGDRPRPYPYLKTIKWRTRPHAGGKGTKVGGTWFSGGGGEGGKKEGCPGFLDILPGN